MMGYALRVGVERVFMVRVYNNGVCSEGGG